MCFVKCTQYVASNDGVSDFSIQVYWDIFRRDISEMALPEVILKVVFQILI